MKDKMKTKWKKLPDIHQDLKPIIFPYKKGLCILVVPFRFHIEFGGHSYEFKIQKGFIFDGASIPRFAWTIAGSPFLPEYIGPALIHDYIYRYHRDNNGAVSRKQADRLYRHLLKLNSVSRYERDVQYTALRSFGQFSW